MSWKQYVTILHFKAKNTGPLHVGAQDGELLIEEESGYAMIPGTSLGGALRAWLKQNGTEEEEVWHFLFGKTDEKTTADLYIHDLVSHKVAIREERPGVRIHGARGVAIDKLERLYIAAGADFQGRMVWTASNEKQNQAYTSVIKKCMQSLHQGICRLGAFKNTGGGRLSLSNVCCRTYNLHQTKDYFDFLHAERLEEAELKRWQKWNLDEEVSLHGYRYALRVRLASPLLIGGQKFSHAGDADRASIQTNDGKWYIPGTSWKGALRHQFRRIADYCGRPELEEQAFGSEADQSANNQRAAASLKTGIVQVADAVLERDQQIERHWVDYYGIHIDKFTGGVMSGALKQERTVRGKATLELYLQPGKQEKDYPAIAGVLLLALRDLAEQGFSLGSGSANGRGYMKGEKLQVSTPEGKVTVDFEDCRIDNQDLANGWIRAIRGVS